MDTPSNGNSKNYVRKVPILWWTRRWVDVRFITRELTSVVVAGYAIVLLFYMRAVSQGPEAFKSFSEVLMAPWSIALHVFSLIALLYHSITWFNLAPKAMVIKVGDRLVPGSLIAGMNYGGWAAASAAILWLIIQMNGA
jgi:fumarate reductase subunit C